MLNILNGQERTLKQFDTLLRKAGWKIERVHHNATSVAAHIIARPV